MSFNIDLSHAGCCCSIQVVFDEKSHDVKIELYPLFFKIYRHTTLPPPVKGSSLPWPLAHIVGSLGLGSFTGPAHPAPPLIMGGGAEFGPAQPPMPRRVAYYQAAFNRCTTVEEVSQRRHWLVSAGSACTQCMLLFVHTYMYMYTGNKFCEKTILASTGNFWGSLLVFSHLGHSSLVDFYCTSAYTYMYINF